MHKLNAVDELNRIKNPIGFTQDEPPGFIF
jgi:hypothetical protein